MQVDDGQIECVEALLRWRDGAREVVSTTSLIEVAEESGLIKPVTNWVLNRALRELAELHDLRISVNLSVHNLDDPEFVELVKRALCTWRVAPERLCLEITETAMMADPDNTREVLHRLSDLGIALSIDDFGSGYSSLRYLKRLPVNNVKIDREFVIGLQDGLGDKRIVEAVTKLGHGFGLTVTAEGVETAACLEFVRQLGCDAAQGNYLSPPAALSGCGAQGARRRAQD